MTIKDLLIQRSKQPKIANFTLADLRYYARLRGDVQWCRLRKYKKETDPCSRK